MMRLRRGLSLLEVVAAMTILAGVLFTLGVLIPQGVMFTRTTGTETTACQLADKMIEDARALGARAVPANAVFDGRPPSPTTAASGFPPAPYPSVTVNTLSDGRRVTTTYAFRVATSVMSSSDHRFPTGLVKMEVQVFWSEARPGGTVDRSWTISSYLDP